MVVNYNVDADLIKPVRNKPKDSEEIALIKEFVESESDNMSFTYDDPDTARKKRNNIAVNCKKRGIRVKALLRENSVIVIRAKEKND